MATTYGSKENAMAAAGAHAEQYPSYGYKAVLSSEGWEARPLRVLLPQTSDIIEVAEPST